MLGTDGGSWASRSTIYWEKAFTCVLSWAYQNLASSQFGQDKATVDVLGMCFIRIPLYLVYSPYFNKGVCAGCGGIVYISAWASALLVLTKLGNAKALMRGTSNRYRFPRFFYK